MFPELDLDSEVTLAEATNAKPESREEKAPGARCLIKTAGCYADLAVPRRTMPSGWAALLHLLGL